MRRKGFMLLLTLFCMLAFSLPQHGVAAETEISDINGHWAEKDITKLIENGAVSGFSDGTFRPNNTITRAEFVKVIVRMFDLQATNGTNQGIYYEDTYREDPLKPGVWESRHWAVDEINIATNLGIVNGTGSNKFSPNAPITREQMAMIIHNLIYTATPFPLQELSNTALDKILIVNKFNDASSIHGGATDKINTLVLLNIMQGDKNGYFKPKSHATRAEAAAILSRVLNKTSDQGVEVVYSNLSRKEIEKEMPSAVKEWIPLEDEENRIWYEEDGVYVGVKRGSDPCHKILLKGLEKTAEKTTVTFQYTFLPSPDLACPAIFVNHVLVVKLPPTENVEVIIPNKPQ